MSEIILGVDRNTSTTKSVPVKRLCRMNGTMCEMATELGYCRLTACVKLVGHLGDIPAADVAPVRRCTNIGEDYDGCDQFVCSHCGIELQGWSRVERDLDDGEITYHEYTFRFCPNCGAKEESD